MDYLLTLEFAGKISITLSLIVVFYAIKQAHLYYHVFIDKNLNEPARIHSKKLLVLMCGIFGIAVSVLLYSSNLIAFDGAHPYRIYLKWAQNISMFGIIYGLHGIKKYYDELR